ncbi:hypothetical protein ACQP1S_06285 [Micromonospora matsumotoense]|uniref:hypothetical protein n=1 Tax=Micromonospora matsumotoense TaxID=121616 RepID=UPI003D8EC64F
MTGGIEWGPVAPELSKDAVAEIADALLPVHLWWAPVTKVVSDQLAVIERFVIEAALHLGEISSGDIAEVTGLPPDLAERVTARVAAAGALEPAATAPEGSAATASVYQPVRPAATEILSSAELREYHRAHLLLMYFPRTGDLVAFDTDSKGFDPSLIHRLTPAFDAPLPPETAGLPVGDFLQSKISAGTVVGLPDWVHSAESDAGDLPETCPAYRCRGYLKRDGKGPVLRLLDARRPDKYPLTLPSRIMAQATGLGAWFEAELAAFDTAFSCWGAPLPGPRLAPPAEGGVWECALPAGLTQAMIADELPVSRPLSLANHDQEITLRVPVRLSPADEAANALFAVDHAAATLLAEPPNQLAATKLAAATQAAADEYGHQPTEYDVVAELWRRRQFFQVYALRAVEDFSYD